MTTGANCIDDLKHEHERLGRLLQTMDSGRWWTQNDPSPVGLTALKAQAAKIHAANDEIENIVGQIGK